MKAFFALAVVALCAVAVTAEWTDLYALPFTGAPGVMAGISCLDSSHCYVAGGSNSQGSHVFSFNGQAGAAMTPVAAGASPMMFLGIRLGGTAAEPKGAACGLGFGAGIIYAENASYFASSQDYIFDQAQNVDVSDDGNHVLVPGSTGSGVSYSGNGGKNFANINVNSKVANGTFGRYGSIVDANTWYVTFGAWPEHSKKPTFRERRLAAMGGKPAKKGTSTYGASIVKTSDGGKTWTTQYSSSTNFYFNGIDCYDADTCVAVGEGFNAGAAGHVFRTTDGGQTWKEVYQATSSQEHMYSMMQVKHIDKEHFWIAGSDEEGGSGLFWESKDGGATFKQMQTMAYVAGILDMSFDKSGTGFAVAGTVDDRSTVLKYTP